MARPSTKTFKHDLNNFDFCEHPMTAGLNALTGQAVFDYSDIAVQCPSEYSWPYRNYIRIDPSPTTWFYAMLADSRITHRFLT